VTDAANVSSGSSESRACAINFVDDDENGEGEDDVWDAVDEIEGYVGVKRSD
jgi:hypothetical protein